MKIESVCFIEQSPSYEDLIHTLTQSLSSLPENKKETIIKEIINRENIASTYTVDGVALPHCRTDEVTGIQTVVGIISKPVMFGQDRNKETHVAFLIISPADEPKNHLRHISKLAKAVKIGEFSEQLKGSKTEDDVRHIINKFCGG